MSAYWSPVGVDVKDRLDDDVAAAVADGGI